MPRRCTQKSAPEIVQFVLVQKLSGASFLLDTKVALWLCTSFPCGFQAAALIAGALDEAGAGLRQAVPTHLQVRQAFRLAI